MAFIDDHRAELGIEPICRELAIAHSAYRRHAARRIDQSLFKAEVIWRQRSWPSLAVVEMATLRWVDWFNNHRLFGPIGYVTPAEAEAAYYASKEQPDMAA